MSELYTIYEKGGRPRFEPREDAALNDMPTPGGQPAGYEVVNRMGDPELLHCAVFRRSEGGGGVFALYDASGFLFAAVAETNLAFGLGLGYFGRLTSYARYGADIFENADDLDD